MVGPITGAGGMTEPSTRWRPLFAFLASGTDPPPPPPPPLALPPSPPPSARSVTGAIYTIDNGLTAS